MTKGPIKNMAASVRQRLMNVSRATNRRFSDVLQHYALERWLFRLSQSKYRDQCILKGALLFVVWKTPATRPTRDIDLLARMNNDLESVRAARSVNRQRSFRRSFIRFVTFFVHWLSGWSLAVNPTRDGPQAGLGKIARGRSVTPCGAR